MSSSLGIWPVVQKLAIGVLGDTSRDGQEAVPLNELQLTILAFRPESAEPVHITDSNRVSRDTLQAGFWGNRPATYGCAHWLGRVNPNCNRSSQELLQPVSAETGNNLLLCSLESVPAPCIIQSNRSSRELLQCRFWGNGTIRLAVGRLLCRVATLQSVASAPPPGQIW